MPDCLRLQELRKRCVLRHSNRLQMLPEFLSQGKHFAAGLGKAVHPEPERYELEAMYGRRTEHLTIEQHVNQVRTLGMFTALRLLSDEMHESAHPVPHH